MTKSLLETDIFNYHTPEFYINMKSVPDKGSSERAAFVLEEKRKGREGININGVWIPGGLYFHLNYYHLEGDDKNNPGKKNVFLPTLRDNEWIIFNDYAVCQKEGKIYLLFGGRQIAKTECEASLCLRELSLYKHTEAMALFANSQYKDTFTKKMITAIAHGEKFMIIPNIDKDWDNNEIRFGLTKQDNSIDLRGRLYIYNTQEGKKTQIGSGKTPSFLLFDEAAASPFRAVLNTMEPALLTDLGRLRCAPMITFTGGETQKAEDAKTLVESPNLDTQFITTLEDGKVVGGRFLNGNYRKDCKVEKTISEYLGKKTDTWLDDYPIMVTDFDYSKKVIEKEREDALKSSDKNTYTLKRIFFPLTLDDVFLTEADNKFNKEAIEQWQLYLKDHYEPSYVEFWRDMNGKVAWKNSQLRPFTKFPISPKDVRDTPVLIFEHPVPNAPNFTYIIGIDPVNKDESNDKIVSLFTIKVFKRMLNPMDEFKDEIVCSYRGRPKELVEAHKIAVMLAEYYNAIECVLPEASEASIFQHFFLKRKGQYLANSFDLQTEIAKRVIKGGGKKGLMPTTVNQRHYMGLMVEYANKEIISITEEGEEEMKYGLTRIKDYMLLEEMKNYRGKVVGRGVHDGNFDSIISFGCALTLAAYYDIKYPITQQIPSSKPKQEVYKSYSVRTPFGTFENKPKTFEFDKPNKPNIPNWMKSR